MIIGFDNKVLAGAWIAGQPDNILRVTNLAKRLHIPLVWLVNCSGVKLPDQEKFYADRRGSARTCSSATPNWSRRAFRCSPASTAPIRPAAATRRISPTILLAHKDANIAVGGVGIVSGMSPQGRLRRRRAGSN